MGVLCVCHVRSCCRCNVLGCLCHGVCGVCVVSCWSVSWVQRFGGVRAKLCVVSVARVSYCVMSECVVGATVLCNVTRGVGLGHTPHVCCVFVHK